MSLYSRYSESSISVSYFSRSSALICSDVLLPITFPASRGPPRAVLPANGSPRRRVGTWSHLSSPLSVTLGRRVGFAFVHHPGARRGRHTPDVDERIAVLGTGAQSGQRRGVRRRAVALVFGETVAGVVGVHRDHQPI